MGREKKEREKIADFKDLVHMLWRLYSSVEAEDLGSSRCYSFEY
jgi:hypothetical protein